MAKKQPDGDVSIQNLQPITSPAVMQWGMNGAVFTITITFNDSTRALQNIKLDRSANLASYSGLAIGGVVIGQPTPGGTLTVSGPSLSVLGFNVFEDIDGKPLTLVP